MCRCSSSASDCCARLFGERGWTWRRRQYCSSTCHIDFHDSPPNPNLYSVRWYSLLRGDWAAFWDWIDLWSLVDSSPAIHRCSFWYGDCLRPFLDWIGGPDSWYWIWRSNLISSFESPTTLHPVAKWTDSRILYFRPGWLGSASQSAISPPGVPWKTSKQSS